MRQPTKFEIEFVEAKTDEGEDAGAHWICTPSLQKRGSSYAEMEFYEQAGRGDTPAVALERCLVKCRDQMLEEAQAIAALSER